VLPGTDLKHEELLLTAHLYEPGASDNASGAAAVIEAGRALAVLVRQGRLAPPRRTIRLLLGHEILGLGAYLFKNRRRLRSLAGGLNLDDVGASFDRRPVLRVHGAHDACPSFVQYFADLLAREHERRFPHLRVIRGDAFAQIDNHGCDPMVGAPMPAFCVHEKALYHTSLDTPEKTDKLWMATHAAVAGTYAYFLASAGLSEAVWLARSGLDAARLRLLSRIQARGAQAPAGRRLAEAIRFYADVEVQGLRALRRFASAFHGPAFDEQTADAVRDLEALAAAERRKARSLTLGPAPQTSAEPREARRLVPKRNVFGLLCLENLSQQARNEQAADPGLRMSVWGGAQNLIFWCDGHRTVSEVAELIGHSTGRYDVELTLRRLRFLDRHGYITLLRRIGRRALARQIRALGIAEGDTVWVHSSLQRIGYVIGGPEAVVGALLDAVGETGDLVMPCFYDSFVSAKVWKPPFDRATSPSEVGRIPEAFRRWPGVVRSAHPTHSVLALGPRKHEITANHAGISPFGRSGPFGWMYEHDVKILFLGCGLGPNSFLHAFEDWRDAPYLRDEDVRAIDERGEAVTVRVPKEPMGHRDFYRGNDTKIGRRLIEAGVVREARVGMAQVFVARGRRMGDFVMDLLDSEPRILLCDRPDCSFCSRF